MSRTVNYRMPEVQPGDYPNADWSEQRTKYTDYWRHFDGSWLDETVSSVNQELKYPLQLNPYNLACMLHAGFLFGEVSDGNDPLVTAVIEPWGQDSPEAQRDKAKRLSEVVNRVWYENGGRAIQQEGGLIAQVLGGAVYGAFYDPELEKKGRLPIRIDHVVPEYFFPVPAFNQYWELLEAIVCFEVTRRQAQLMYGLGEGETNQVLYQERWTADAYEIVVDGQTAIWKGVNLEGKPIGQRVPYTYIPHIRAGEFYGTSLLENKKNLAAEVNERFADVGDIISENARLLPAIRNTNRVGIKELGSGVTVIDLGKQVGQTGEPDIVYPSGTGSGDSSVKWAMELLNQARTEAFTPPVVYGADEGSQRSALTLAFRMLPLLVHIRQERTMWQAGLNEIARMILTIAAEKRIGGVKPEDLKNIRIWQEWAPIMPRDREMMVNELIMLHEAGLKSPEAALQQLGDVKDMKTELNLIKAWQEQKAKLEAMAQPDPFKGSGGKGQQAGLPRTSKPSPSLKKE